MEVELGNGVVSFDGRVVELFGFGVPQAVRAHVRLIESIEIVEKRIIGTTLDLQVRGAPSHGAALQLDGDQGAQLKSLIEAIHTAMAS